MQTTKSLIVATAMVFIGNLSIAKDGLVPSKKEAEKPIGIVTVKVGNEVKAFALSKEHQALLDESKKLAREIEQGRAKEDSDDVIANQTAIKQIAGIEAKPVAEGEKLLEPTMAKGVTLVGITAITNKNLDRASGKTVKANCYGGYGYGGGYTSYYAYGAGYGGYGYGGYGYGGCGGYGPYPYGGYGYGCGGYGGGFYRSSVVVVGGCYSPCYPQPAFTYSGYSYGYGGGYGGCGLYY